MTTKAILFDADGVIIHSEMFSLQYQRLHNVSNDDMLPFFKKDFQPCLIGKADLIEVVKPWLSKWKWDKSAPEFLDLWFKAEDHVDERMISKIKQLRSKGIKCYLATNQEKYRTEYMKNQMGFNNLFDHIFSSADISYTKPAKEYYEYILNRLKTEQNIKPEELMFFDDTQENVDTAIDCNINSHLFNFEEFEYLIKQL